MRLRMHVREEYNGKGHKNKNPDADNKGIVKFAAIRIGMMSVRRGY